MSIHYYNTVYYEWFKKKINVLASNEKFEIKVKEFKFR